MSPPRFESVGEGGQAARALQAGRGSNGTLHLNLVAEALDLEIRNDRALQGDSQFYTGLGGIGDLEGDLLPLRRYLVQ
jgi:hypothetical protein